MYMYTFFTDKFVSICYLYLYFILSIFELGCIRSWINQEPKAPD